MISQALQDFWNTVNTVLDYEHDPVAGEFYVYSVVLDRVFSGSTLTIARTQRSEAERVYREHHAKND